MPMCDWFAPSPHELAAKIHVYELFMIGKFMRGRAGVWGRVASDFSPAPSINLPAKCSDYRRFLRQVYGEVGTKNRNIKKRMRGDVLLLPRLRNRLVRPSQTPFLYMTSH